MRDFMIDVETTGTQPDRHAMIQLAAVRFYLDTGDVDASSMFNRCLTIPENRAWDQSTKVWWQRQPAVLDGIQARMEPHALVLKAFCDWAGYHNSTGKPNRFWAKPITFDYMFVSSALSDEGLHNPFHFREAMDCRSYLRGLSGGDDYVREQDLEFQGVAHDAIFDVLHQIKWLLHNQKKYGRSAVIEQAAE
jgi:hypothetical protein